jgi:hypothetical protein
MKKLLGLLTLLLAFSSLVKAQNAPMPAAAMITCRNESQLY